MTYLLASTGPATPRAGGGNILFNLHGRVVMKLPMSRTAILLLAASAALAVHGANALAWQAPAAPPAAVPAPGSDEAEGIVLDRQLVMQQLDKDAMTLGNIAAGLTPRAQLEATAKNLAKGAREAAKSFELNVPGGAAKPEVWTNAADFNKRMQEFVTKSDLLVANSGNPDMFYVGTLMIDALQCKQCHDVYRVKK